RSVSVTPKRRSSVTAPSARARSLNTAVTRVMWCSFTVQAQECFKPVYIAQWITGGCAHGHTVGSHGPGRSGLIAADASLVIPTRARPPTAPSPARPARRSRESCWPCVHGLPLAAIGNPWSALQWTGPSSSVSHAPSPSGIHGDGYGARLGFPEAAPP